jgi:hypothetical protein
MHAELATVPATHRNVTDTVTRTLPALGRPRVAGLGHAPLGVRVTVTNSDVTDTKPSEEGERRQCLPAAPVAHACITCITI